VQDLLNIQQAVKAEDDHNERTVTLQRLLREVCGREGTDVLLVVAVAAVVVVVVAAAA
jgi:hypothetical protein